MARTDSDQAFWDAIFKIAFEGCMRERKQRGAEGCAHLAREHADVALSERRASVEAQP